MLHYVNTLRQKTADKLFGDIIETRVQHAVKVVDDKWWAQVGAATTPADRAWTERVDDLRDALDAWRVNPLARRIVQLTTDYVVGDGIGVTATASPELTRFVHDLWTHRLNRIDLRLAGLCDELTRAGELFPILFPNPADGLSYLRFIPAAQIRAVDTDPDDYEREFGYWQVLPPGPSPTPPSFAGKGAGGLGPTGLEGRYWKGLDHPDLRPDEPVMLHYTVNRPIGATRGEGDLGPILIWLRRYRDWLEGRVRVNKLKTAFLWDVTVPDQAIAQTKQKYSVPPRDGSIIVHGEAEKWSAVQPAIAADDADADGKALRQMIAVGAATPPHFLSDPEGATQATAHEANEPTFRHFLQRQKTFLWLLGDMLAVAAMRAQASGRLSRSPTVQSAADLGLRWTTTDLNRDDNLTLARSASLIVNALGQMVERGWATDAEAAALAFKFAGELVDPEEIAARLRVKAYRTASRQRITRELTNDPPTVPGMTHGRYSIIRYPIR
jgi:predicted transcriptional regulator